MNLYQFWNMHEFSYFLDNLHSVSPLKSSRGWQKVSGKMRQDNINPSPNGLTRNHKLKTWVYLWLCLTRPYVHLCWLAMSCDPLCGDQICTQVKKIFHHLATQPKSHQVEWIPSTCSLFFWVLQFVSSTKNEGSFKVVLRPILFFLFFLWISKQC